MAQCVGSSALPLFSRPLLPLFYSVLIRRSWCGYPMYQEITPTRQNKSQAMLCSLILARCPEAPVASSFGIHNLAGSWNRGNRGRWRIPSLAIPSRLNLALPEMELWPAGGVSHLPEIWQIVLDRKASKLSAGPTVLLLLLTTTCRLRACLQAMPEALG